MAFEMVRTCKVCEAFAKKKGLPIDRRFDEVRRLPDGKWHHKSKFGRMFHKLALQSSVGGSGDDVRTTKEEGGL